jgi:hypothetical protein
MSAVLSEIALRQRLLTPANKDERVDLDSSEGPAEAEVPVPRLTHADDRSYGVIVALITLDRTPPLPNSVGLSCST